MFLFTLAFLMGDLYLQSQAELPSLFFIFLISFACFLIWYYLRWSYLYLLLAFILGLAWSTWYAHSLLSWTLPKPLEGQPVLITGYIASIPISDRWGKHFLFALQQLQDKNKKEIIKTTLRLNWHHPPSSLQVGDQYQFIVKLKRIHSTQNKGAFDFEAWALQKGLRATGYIIQSKYNTLLNHHPYRYPIDHIREALQEKIKAYLPHSKTAPWLIALIMGERNDIEANQWQILRQTGTNHLMAIAGLHIGMMAAFAHTLIAWVWQRIPKLCLRLPAMQAGACAALVIALLYSALAGFSVPTQRACIMLAVFIFALLSKRQIKAWHAWSFALLLVLCINPLSVLTESFWLSFGTIALIIYGMSGRLAPSGFWWKWGRVQWVIGIGLLPLTLSLFQQASLISFLANSIAIPWLGFFILPFCLLSLFFLYLTPSIGWFFLWIADKSLAGLWEVLSWLSALHFSSWQQAIPHYLVLFTTIIGILLLLLPSGFPGRWLGITWLMPLLLYQAPRPALGDFWVTLLDVGQGLSVVIQTQKHTLVYDAGPKYNAHFDTGDSIVLPYLRSINTKQIDMLVISHGDNDHIGGAQALLKALPILSIKTSTPDKIKSPDTQYCLAGYAWRWDNVHFSFLYPTQHQLHLGNDSSCVLRIDNGQQIILLTGDIEKYAEQMLLTNKISSLAATILVAPHHGSKTSGLEPFLAAVHPTFVLYATGYRNRYHFPHQRIVDAYTKIHAIQLNTAETGAIQFKLAQRHLNLTPERYRLTHKRYWMD